MKVKTAIEKVVGKHRRAADALGLAMIADLKELIATVSAGVPLESKYTVRTVEVPDAPGAYDPAAIRATRDRIGASQAVFGHLVGVSVKLVQGREQSRIIQDPPQRRRARGEYRRKVNNPGDPKHWRGMLKKPS